MLVQLRGSRTDGPGRIGPEDEGSSSAAQARGRTRRRLGYSSVPDAAWSIRHDIVWYGSKYHADSIVRSVASFRPIRSTADYGDGRYDERFPGRDRFHGLRKVVFDFEHAFVNSTAGYLTDLREICHEFHPDPMVHDPAVIAGAIMGISDGLPAATINISVQSIEGRNVGPFSLGLLPADGPLGRLRNRATFGLVHYSF
jgi:hypothetical protein